MDDLENEMPKSYSSPRRICCVVIFACAVDAADKALLPATFKAMEEELQIGPRDLGALSFAQSIAFSLALPLWGSLMQYHRPRDLLAAGCFLWGFFTLMVSCSSSYLAHFNLRLLIGASLAVVMPIGQAMICDLVPEQQRGSAFGLMKSLCSVLAELSTFVTTATARGHLWGISGWRIIYAAVALLSLAAAMLVRAEVPGHLSAAVPNKGRSWMEEQARVLRTVCQKPTFFFMVAQGVTGGIPWHAFAFLPFYFQLCGYRDVDAAEILLYGGFGSIVAGVLGGILGDRCHRLWPFCGRCLVALLSVIMGILFFTLVMVFSDANGSFWLVVLLMFTFHLTGTWTQSAALRPMCGDIVRDSHDRAQILALWIAFEGIISSFCGAPLAGTLSEAFGYSLSDPSRSTSTSARSANIAALRSALLGVSVVPWTLCGLAWIPMFCTYPKDAGQMARTFAA